MIDVFIFWLKESAQNGNNKVVLSSLVPRRSRLGQSWTLPWVLSTVGWISSAVTVRLIQRITESNYLNSGNPLFFKGEGAG